MKRILAFLLSIFIGAILFVWIGESIGWREIKNSFLVFSGWHGLLILLITLLAILVMSWRWREILKGVGVILSFWEVFKLSLASFSFSIFLPMTIFSGDIFRAITLKEKNQIRYSKGVSSIVIERVLEWTVRLLIVFFTFLFLVAKLGSSFRLGKIFWMVFLVLFGAIFFFYFKALKRESFLKIFIKNDNHSLFEVEREIFDFFKHKRNILIKGILTTLFRNLILGFRVWLLLFFLGKNVSFSSLLSVLGVYYLALLTPIPTALGTHEAFQAFTFNVFQIGSATATAFTMITRAADIILALGGVGVLYSIGIGFIKSILLKNNSKI